MSALRRARAGPVLFFTDILWPVLHDAYMLLLTLSMMCLVVALRWRESMGWRHPMPGFGWFRSFGCLSYEIYLTHMFVVFAAVRPYRAFGSDIGLGYLWYVPVVVLCWLLGMLVARVISTPCDHALRGVLLKPQQKDCNPRSLPKGV